MEVVGPPRASRPGRWRDAGNGQPARAGERCRSRRFPARLPASSASPYAREPALGLRTRRRGRGRGKAGDRRCCARGSSRHGCSVTRRGEQATCYVAAEAVPVLRPWRTTDRW
jgi:hypothetical protein